MEIVCDYIKNGVNKNLKEFLNINILQKKKELILNVFNDLGNHQKNNTENQQVKIKTFYILKNAKKIKTH